MHAGKGECAVGDKQVHFTGKMDDPSRVLREHLNYPYFCLEVLTRG